MDLTASRGHGWEALPAPRGAALGILLTQLIFLWSFPTLCGSTVLHLVTILLHTRHLPN